MKRRRAYDRRQKTQQQKKSELFKSVQSNFSRSNKRVCKYMTRKLKEIKPILPDRLIGIQIWPYRLRGGADRQDTNEVTLEKSLLNLEESISPMIKKLSRMHISMEFIFVKGLKILPMGIALSKLFCIV